MNKEEATRILVFLSKMEGFARATHKNEMLPEDMWNEMQYVSNVLAGFIMGNKEKRDD